MRTLPDSSLTDAEWAWCAGLFEGEGCISFVGKTSVTLSLAMVDRDVVDRLDALWPSPSGPTIKRKPEGNDQWAWQVRRRERVQGFLEGIYPWLGGRRRAKADEAFERLARNLGARAERTVCVRGHPLSGDNVRRNRNGSRQCRTCTNDRQRAYRASQPA